MLYGFVLALLCFIAGCFSHLAMAPYSYGITLFIGIPALFYALQRAEKKRLKFLFTWLFAFGYFIFSLSWIPNALIVPGNEEYAWAYPLAMAGLPALLALFPAFCVTFMTMKSDLEHLGGWWMFVLALCISELARGYLFTGFPWNNYAYTWISVLPIAQTVSIGGLYFLTFLTIFWAATPGLIFLHKRCTPALITFMIAAVTFGACFYYGHHRLKTEPVYALNQIVLHLVQPNVQQQDKWNPAKLESHFDNLAELSTTALGSNKNKMNVVIWPETASARSIMFSEENTAQLNQILPKDSKNYLITGLLHGKMLGDKPLFFNSMTILGPGQSVVGNYDKHHLVPFGEYIPFQHLIPLTPVVNFSGFRPGPGPQRIQLTKSFAISPLICYEVIFPDISLPKRRKRVPQPNLIVNVTNDAWYGDSPGPKQHLVQAQFRAIETGIPVARVANTGISALISPLGRNAAHIPYGQRSYRSHPLLLPLQNETIFAIYGQKIMVGLLLLICSGVYIFRKEH